MVRLLVIADDLTGAIETGGQFAKEGIRTIVSGDLAIDTAIISEGIEVLVINTESRHISSEDAAINVSYALEVGRKLEVEHVYKKVDSTLRGNIGIELEVVLMNSRQEVLPFIPAHPKVGRYTINGSHYVGDTLLHNTSFAEDPLEPITSSYIPDILQKQTSLPVEVISLRTSGGHKIEYLPGARIILYDCMNYEDLRKIVPRLEGKDYLSVVAGSAALAELLPGILDFNREKKKEEAIKGPVLVVNGSLNPISCNQVVFAEEKGVKCITILPELLLLEEDSESDKIDDFIQDIELLYSQGENLMIKTLTSLEGISTNLDEQTCRIIAERIGIIVSGIMKTMGFKTVVIFGGDTLSGIMKALKIRYIYPHNEILNGVVVSSVGEDENEYTIISKPGGFGEPNDLVKILKIIN